MRKSDNQGKSHSGDQRTSAPRMSISTDDGRYPTYPRGKSSKITYNYDFWRAHRPDELKGVSSSTGIAYYLIFSLYILLFCLLIYYHISVPSKETEQPARPTKPADKDPMLSMNDVVHTYFQRCNVRSQFETSDSLLKKAMRALTCALKGQVPEKYTYLAFSINSAKVVSGYEQITPRVAEKIASVRPQCYQDCHKYDIWITNHAEINHRYKRSRVSRAKQERNNGRSHFEYDQFVNDDHFRLYYPREIQEAQFVSRPLSGMQECFTSYDIGAQGIEAVYIFLICFIAELKTTHQLEKYNTYQAASMFNISTGHHAKCAIGASYYYSQRSNFTSPEPVDYLIVCGDVNVGNDPLLGIPFILFDDRLRSPLALAIAPNGKLRNYQTITLQLAAYYYERTTGMEPMTLLFQIYRIGVPVYLPDKPEKIFIDDVDFFYDEAAWLDFDSYVNYVNWRKLDTDFGEAAKMVNGLKRSRLSHEKNAPGSSIILGLLPDIGKVAGFQINGITVRA